LKPVLVGTSHVAQLIVAACAENAASAAAAPVRAAIIFNLIRDLPTKISTFRKVAAAHAIRRKLIFSTSDCKPRVICDELQWCHETPPV
jgi:hypothetical protein